MDSWKRFNETTQPDKKALYSELNSEDFTNKDYVHAQNVITELNIKPLVIIMVCMFKAIHYCFLMYLKTLETSVLKYKNLTPLIFCLHWD